jgi:hypothetical protein
VIDAGDIGVLLGLGVSVGERHASVIVSVGGPGVGGREKLLGERLLIGVGIFSVSGEVAQRAGVGG